MQVTRPQDLPDFRLWLLDQWKPDMPYDRLERISDVIDAHHPELLPQSAPGEPPFGRITGEWDVPALERSVLYWVTEDMVTLIEHAVKTLPPTTLTRELVPSTCGLVFFERPLQGKDSENPDHVVEVSAILWAPVNLQYDNIGTYLGLGAYGIPQEIDNFVVPYGRTDWKFGADTEEPTTDQLSGQQLRLESMAEDRRWFATFCLMMATSGIAETSDAALPRQLVRRVARDGRGGPAKVRIVDVLNRRSTTPSGEGTGHKIDHDHRWLVTGHWRRQAYGPKRTLRRPVWINDHIRGPEDKPLVVRDAVRVLRPPQEES